MQKARSRRIAPKETRLSVRINPAQKAVIARAARLRHTTLTDFVVNQAYQAASQLVADETHIRMAPDQFKRFCQLLDAPPAKNLKALQKLLGEPSVLDD
jgi:uncharacterized protein (DUF1778 family)